MRKLLAISGALLVCSSVLGAQSGTAAVLSTDNIYAAAGNAALGSFGGGGGTAPVSIGLNAGTGRVLSLTSAATGSWTCTFGGDLSGPDGGPCAGPNTNIDALNKISGYKATNTMTLVGLFLGASLPGSAPATLDFTGAGAESFCGMSGLSLGQVFFIGDGRGFANCTQQFFVPDAATQFYFGVADAFGFTGTPGFYDDNSGTVSASYSISSVSTVPEPSTTALLAAGLAALVMAGRRRQRRQT